MLSVFLWQSIAPDLEWIAPHLRVVESAVTRDLHADEVWFFEGFFLAVQFYFGHHQPIVVAIELIDLKSVSFMFDKVASFVDDAWLAKP